MPAPINTNVQKATNSTDKSHSKKTRVPRRRGRGKDALDSDDEIEREVTTDSETDDQSSYASDSESESASDDEGHNGIVTPSTTQSPPPLDINGQPSSLKKPADLVNGSAGPFVSPTNWAQLVADEDANGTAELPIIDFADMHTQILVEPEPKPAPPRSRKTHKLEKKAEVARAPPEPPVQPATKAEPTEAPSSQPADEPIASTSRGTSREPDVRRPRGQSARQVYQQRLQDPAFVPRVGEFWGHDDRLLDKDLRSLSGWWRGRWQHRGRGRGGFPARGRGGQAYTNGAPSHADQGQEGSGTVTEDVSPADRAWGHDGFEEMKRKEDIRKEERRPKEQQQPEPHSFGAQRGFRGRGGFFGGRGRGFARGGGVATTPGVSSHNTQDPSTQRVWFAMKPEKVWTKHTDTFLYFEPVLRARPGQAAGVRIKLPGGTGHVVRSRRYSHAPSFTTQAPAVVTSTAAAHEENDRQFIVRIPHPPASKEEPTPQPTADAPEVATTMEELSIEEVFTVRPHAVPSHIPLSASGAPTTEVADVAPAPSATTSQTGDAYNAPPIALDSQVQENSDQQASAVEPVVDATQAQVAQFQPSTVEVVAPVPQTPVSIDQARPPPPVLPPLQTAFSPVPQTSPQYGSPYAYAPALPPGIAMSHQGFPYDMATGRPVYLQTPPPSMYTPRPMMPGYMAPPASSMPFVPGHMHHPSQEFIPQTQTPPINGFVDPATGLPLFSPPRQSSRIEIRAPSDRYEGKSAPRPSGLRTSINGLESANAGNGDVTQSELQMPIQPQQQPPMPAMDPAMMAYAQYHQQYYYADPNGYPTYMDMSQQMMPYEMYPPPPPDQRTPQPVIYY